VATFEIHESAVAVTFSPDDDMLVCGLKGGSIRVWDVQTNNLVQTFKSRGGAVRSVAVSPCGNIIASGSGDNADETVRIWDVPSGRCK
jgi:WD40 repeat protein